MCRRLGVPQEKTPGLSPGLKWVSQGETQEEP